MLCIVEFNENN